MQESYSIGLILLIYITIRHNNVVFELLVSLVCGPVSKFKTMETSSCHNLSLNSGGFVDFMPPYQKIGGI